MGCGLLLSASLFAQKVSIDPTIEPEEFKADEEITITYDVTGTDLEGLESAWIWTWIKANPDIDAPSNINPASSDPSKTDVAKFTKTIADGKTTFSITFTPTVFFNRSSGEINEMGMLLKGNDWTDGQTTDFATNVGTSGSAAGKHEVQPNILPDFPKADEELTIQYDVTGSPLENLTEAWLWLWLPDQSQVDVPTNVNPASSDPSLTDKAKFTREIVDGKTIFSISIILTEFTDKTVEQIKQVGVLIKGNDWGDGQSTDFVFEITDGFAMKVNSPKSKFAFYESGDVIDIDVVISASATITVSIDNAVVEEVTGATTLQYSHEVITDGLVHEIEIEARNPSNFTDVAEFIHTYSITPNVTEAAVPTGMMDGINYHTDNKSATLVLTAPNKDNVFVLGDFNDWALDQDFLMNKDSDKFWLEITDLQEGQEYLYQYLVDGEVVIADPYSEKVSSSFDDGQIIAEGRYPGLRQFPNSKTEFEATYLQTAQEDYQWEVLDFEKPAKEDLVVYELLVRDFTEDRTYNAVTERLDYLDSLGINAIELMPVTEFEGNISWGYNPSYKLAPDKFYGTEDDLKRLIDEAHKRGMAVIFDMVLNHHFGRSPLVRMEASGEFGPPTADNVWFNVTPKHDFNVGYDFDHESQYTKDYVDRVVTYWTEEYKVDGYRFDLSKGFTQVNSLGDVGFWGQYDISRVNLLKRMADVIWEQDPDTYVILEHFADNPEERDLANAGMMLWGNVGGIFRNLARGVAQTIDWLYYDERGWQDPHVIGYMESHDEERVLFEIRNSEGSLKQKLNRLQLNAVFFFAVPGPKMIWQFGEFGYDIELNDDRLGIKPTKWEYLEDPDRRRLFDVYQAMINLKTNTNYIDDQYFTWKPTGELKWVNYEHPEVQIAIYGNFGTSEVTGDPNFPSSGDWYNYFTGEVITVLDPNEEVSLRPGEFFVYTSEPIDNFIETDPIDFVLGSKKEIGSVNIYPNPTAEFVKVETQLPIESYRVVDLAGRELIIGGVSELRISEIEIDLSDYDPGIYILEFITRNNEKFSYRIMKTFQSSTGN